MTGPKRAYILVTILFLSLVTSSFAAWGRPGLLWGFMLGLFFYWLTFFFANDQLINLFNATPVEGQDPWGLLPRLRQLSQRARLPMPKAYIFDSQTMNTYAIARNHKNSSIVLSSGLVSGLSGAELSAVLAHQVACIKSLETVNFSVSSFFMNIILFFKSNQSADIGYSQNPGWGADFFRLFVCLTMPLLVMIRRVAVSRKCYYSLDQRAVELTQDPTTYVETLWKLQSYARARRLQISPVIAHLFMVNPLTNRGLGRYFQAQPQLEDRIRRLVGYYPI